MSYSYECIECICHRIQPTLKCINVIYYDPLYCYKNNTFVQLFACSIPISYRLSRLLLHLPQW